MPYSLQGRNVLVTGGSRGLGAIICEKFAREGSNVAINYANSAEAAEKLASDLRNEFPSVKIITIQADMGKEEDCNKVVETTIKEFGGIDVIISNAGWTRFSALDDINATLVSDWDMCFAVNVKAQNFLLKAALDTFKANPEGGVFLVTSSIAGVGNAGSSLPYCVTKAAGLQWVKVMAAHMGHKVRISAVLPGLLLTEWGKKFPEAVIKQLEERASLKKVTDLEDCAQAFIDLARNSSMTGQRVIVDSGLSQL